MAIEAPGMGATEPVRLLVVCTGNLCRSPLTERLLAAQLRAHGIGPQQVQVTSAGVAARPGGDMDPRTRAVLLERGIEADGFAGQLLSAELLTGADLVLTAERAHRAAAARLLPRVTRKAFTLAEFARLVTAEGPPPVEDLPSWPQRFTAAVQAVGARRGLILGGGDDDDLPDPIAGSIEDFRHCADTVALAAGPVVDLLLAAVGS